jgi:lipopolysaccharide export LptBFGC system permease protein LptF
MLNDRLVPLTNRLTVNLVHDFILNQRGEIREADRSPQEQSLAEVDRRIAAQRAARDQAVAQGDSYQHVAKLDKELRTVEIDRHLKLALPTYALPLMALGFAIGSLLARRRPVPVWLHIGIAIATTIAIYLAMSFARASEAFSGSPAAAAWAPLLVPAIAAAAFWAYAKITRKGVYADV